VLKLIIPIKKYLKQIGIKEIQNKIILDYNKTCDNICQQNLGTVRKLLITERNVLRRIFRLTNDRDSTWRIKTNGELNNLVRNKNTVTYIKAQRLS